jgi:hypothetical protein
VEAIDQGTEIIRGSEARRRRIHPDGLIAP